MKVAANTTKKRGEDVSKAPSAHKDREPVIPQEYQTIFTTNGRPMVILEADATIALANAEFERLSGYPNEEVEGTKKWTEFVAREDRKRMREYHRMRRSDSILAPRCFEFQFVDRQGAVKNVVLTMGQIPGTNKSMASLLDVTDRRREQDELHRDTKELKERLKETTGELAKAKEALQGEIIRRKQAEEALRETEEKYSNIFDSMLEGYFEVDLAGNFTFFNKAVSNFYGYTRDELMGLNYREFTSPKEAERFLQVFSEIFTTGNPHEIDDYEIIKKDGSRGIAELSASLLRNTAGEPIGFCGVTRDVTEKREAQQALQESEKRYRIILETMQDAYYETDLAGRFTFVNDALCGNIGYNREELLGTDNRQYQDETTAKKLYQVYNEVYRTGEPVKAFESEYIRKDGTKGTYEMSASLIRDADGKPIGFRGISRDISERKQIEEALQESEEKYRTMLANIGDAYTETDFSGRITFYNKAVSASLGYSEEEFVGMHYKEYTSPEQAKKVYDVYSRVYKTGEPAKSVELEYRAKDGTTRILETTVDLMRDKSGKPIGFKTFTNDITRRRQAEEALRRSEEKYRGILESIEDGYAEMDLHGTITFSNDALPRILGYPKDALKSLTYKNREYMDEENAERVYQAYTEIYNTGQPNRGLQYEIIAQDGTRRSLESSVSLKKDADGKPVGFQGVVRDITERKRAEEAVRQSEERYRTIIETIEDGYYEIDLAGNFTFFNDVVCNNLGYTREELLMTDNRQYQDEAAAKKSYEIYREIYRTGKPVKAVESEYIRKDGTKRIYELSASLIRDTEGKPIGYRGISRDVTERKKMQEALRQSEERYRTILETMQEAYYETDLVGHFTFINDALCRHLGYSREELFEMDYRELQDETDAKKTYQTFNEIYRTGKPVEAREAEYTRKDGSKGIYEVSVSLIKDAQGKPIGFRGVSRDVTERKKAEERLQRYATELERSNEEVKNFAYIVSHDLRVPLVNLKGYTSELNSALGVIGTHFDAALPHLTDEARSDVALALHEDVPEALEFITNSVSRMDSFINAVLILSRLGRRELKPEPLDMNALVQTALEPLSYQIQERGVAVKVGSLPQVVADRTSMEQIIGNILGNAVKYLDLDRAGEIEINAERNHSETIFRIRDTGRGIAAEDMHKVFAPFRRAGRQDTPGEGMGLAYVQTLVRRHGGRIWCESELGKGTTFTFTIAHPSGKGVHDD